MNILRIEKTDSTNNYIKEHSDRIEPMTLVSAGEQTAGRGQRGNSWESEPGKNLTFSFYFSPDKVRPREQFAISEAVSLALLRTLEEFGIAAHVKWPNDIYVGDKKISGILIENSITGDTISRSIVGIGLNVNQEIFRSNAPNPVSMTMITGEKYDLEEVLAGIGRNMEEHLLRLLEKESLHQAYKDKLWRKEGAYNFRDKATGENFSAEIEDVEPEGRLVLRDKGNDSLRRYAFKEVEFGI